MTKPFQAVRCCASGHHATRRLSVAGMLTPHSGQPRLPLLTDRRAREPPTTVKATRTLLLTSHWSRSPGLNCASLMTPAKVPQVQWAGLMYLLSSHAPNEHLISDKEQSYLHVRFCTLEPAPCPLWSIPSQTPHRSPWYEPD